MSLPGANQKQGSGPFRFVCQALHVISFGKCVPGLSKKLARTLAQVLEGAVGVQEAGVAEGLSCRDAVSPPDILGSPPTSFREADTPSWQPEMFRG